MKNLSLNAKIMFVLVVFITASCLISFIGIFKLHGFNDSLNNLTNVVSARLLIVKNMDALTNRLRGQETLFILEESREGMNRVSDELDRVEGELIKSLADYRKLAMQDFYDEIDEMNLMLKEWNSSSKAMRELSLAGNNKEAYQIARGKNQEILTKFDNNIQTIVKQNEEFMKLESERTNNEYLTSRNLIFTVSVVAILIGIGLAFVILRAVNNSINHVIANLNDNSNQVTSAAQQIAASSEELSQAATEQASSLEETASSIEEMNSMVQKNAENAQRTSDLATSSSNSAEKGKQVVREMIVAIDDISISNNTIMEQIDASNQQISDIVRVIAEIGEKTKVINDIVFQTKLLSFNASVEAARAGEHGKGFAVVAEEVGNLAQMSGNAAMEISSMLENSIQKVEGIVTQTKQKVGTLVSDGRTKVEVGSRIAKECGVVLEEIVNNVSSVTQMANEISTACQEQAQGVQEITKAMNQLDQVTQTNAATSEEAASAAEELSSQADSLRSVVGVLIKTIKGENSKEATTSDFQAPQAEVRKSTSKFRNDNVVPMRKQKPTFTKQVPSFKKAVGSITSSIPSENDPRFEDI